MLFPKLYEARATEVMLAMGEMLYLPGKLSMHRWYCTVWCDGRHWMDSYGSIICFTWQAMCEYNLNPSCMTMKAIQCDVMLWWSRLHFTRGMVPLHCVARCFHSMQHPIGITHRIQCESSSGCMLIQRLKKWDTTGAINSSCRRLTIQQMCINSAA